MALKSRTRTTVDDNCLDDHFFFIAGLFSVVEFFAALLAQAPDDSGGFSKAVDQLGTVRQVMQMQTYLETEVQNNWEQEQPNLEIRHGGLSTMQCIYEDSLSDHVRIIETLCTYVRPNALRNARYNVDAKGRHPDG